MRTFIIEIDEALFQDIKTSMEDMGEEFEEKGDIGVLRGALEEGLMSMIIPDIERVTQIGIQEIQQDPNGEMTELAEETKVETMTIEEGTNSEN